MVFRYVGDNCLLLPVKILPKICIFGCLGPKIGIFDHLVPCLTKTKTRTRCWGGFSVIWVPFLPPVKIRIFGPKMAIFAPKYTFLGTYRPCRLIWCPVGWLVVGCGVQAVSRKTPSYFIFLSLMITSLSLSTKLCCSN